MQTISRTAHRATQQTAGAVIPESEWPGDLTTPRSDRQRDGERMPSGPAHLIASGLVGEPTAPVIGMAGATNMNS